MKPHPIGIKIFADAASPLLKERGRMALQ